MTTPDIPIPTSPLVYVLLTTIILLDSSFKQHINYQFLQFLTLVEASKPLILLNYLPMSLL